MEFSLFSILKNRKTGIHFYGRADTDMIASQVMIGTKLKQIRKQHNMTLSEVAKKLKVSSPFLSMVENGRSGISLSNLQKLLAIYGLSMGDLIDIDTASDRVVAIAEAASLGNGRDVEGVEALLLVNNTKEKRMEPLLFRLDPGASLGPMQHEGEEFSHVIEGNFRVILGNPEIEECDIYELSEGDTIYFNSSIPHTWINVSPDKLGVFLGAVTPATL